MSKIIRGFTAFFLFSMLMFMSLASPSAGDAFAPGQAEVNVPILMYHGLTDTSSHVNQYFIPVSTFENDMNYLKDNGYHSITMTQLIDFVLNNKGTAKLPEKPVVISFDDGYYNNLRFATPILKTCGMKAVVSVIGSACQQSSDTEYMNDDYRNITWDELSRMQETGVWEIQNHTWNMHSLKNRKGARQNPNESFEEYKSALSQDLLSLQKKVKECTGETPNTFTWPFGAYTSNSRDLLRSIGFQAGLLCSPGINHIVKGDKNSLFGLKRQLRTPQESIQSLLE